jgi:hypothetical protein
MKLYIIIFALLIVMTSSCREKDDCYPKFKKSLSYLKESIKPGNKKTYYVLEITKNIEVLESIAGIKNNDQGNIIGKFIVLQRDIEKWENWIFQKCHVNKNKKQ